MHTRPCLKLSKGVEAGVEPHHVHACTCFAWEAHRSLHQNVNPLTSLRRSLPRCDLLLSTGRQVRKMVLPSMMLTPLPTDTKFMMPRITRKCNFLPWTVLCNGRSPVLRPCTLTFAHHQRMARDGDYHRRRARPLAPSLPSVFPGLARPVRTQDAFPRRQQQQQRLPGAQAHHSQTVTSSR